MNPLLNYLRQHLEGEVLADHLTRVLYATDASVYREIPAAVVLPKTESDIRQLVQFAREQGFGLIPRAAGTSLAGQCVGNGIVVDVSKYFTKILELNEKERWVRVQPGVIRDDLNVFLKPYGLFFGPNTSTSNRSMIGGMVGNNSCGSTSIKYGTTRDKVLELKVILSDGSMVAFSKKDLNSFFEKCEGETLEARLYRQIHQALHRPEVRTAIEQAFPKAGIHRRNTGYAVDALLQSELFTEGGNPFNFCQLLAGSEGTLAFTTEITLQLDPLPPPAEVVLAAHFESVQAALQATLVAMEYQPYACELMDKIVLDCTKTNREHQRNRFFLQGDPAAVLCIECRGQTIDEAQVISAKIARAMQQAGLGYAFPQIPAPDAARIWALRNAGLGLLANLPGDAKAVACIEDTAVAVQDLPAYIAEFQAMMERFGQKAVFYAHAGAGELHLRPLLNLKKAEDRQAFRAISAATADLVKKYSGSLSGEHGDGRVRAEFIPKVLGPVNYRLFQEIKATWDPLHLFNPGKIVDAPPMDQGFRYEAGMETPVHDTLLDFSAQGGFLRAVENCNGTGVCRKLPTAGGTMCPSYMATRDEKDSTRGRANALREYLTRHGSGNNPFRQEPLKEVLDLCLSCKGCTSECPSNVDMASMKAEFLHQYYQGRLPLRSWLFANIDRINRLGSSWPGGYNVLALSGPGSWLIKKIMRVAPERALPKLAPQTLRAWFRKKGQHQQPANPVRTLFLLADEFTNYLDVSIGVQAIQLLQKLGYEVLLVKHPASGRAHISKGALPTARKLAEQQVERFAPLITPETPLIGIEPSAILGFRDEYLRLVRPPLREAARQLAPNCLLIDEFLAQEFQAGRFDPAVFSEREQTILLHGHCHQKALASVEVSRQILEIPVNYQVEVIPSGCCGMAGSFGYEQEHFELSMKIGELVLFPSVRKAGEEVLIAAPGTSCRHQILDGTRRKAQHPVEILWQALL